MRLRKARVSGQSSEEITLKTAGADRETSRKSNRKRSLVLASALTAGLFSINALTKAESAGNNPGGQTEARAPVEDINSLRMAQNPQPTSFEVRDVAGEPQKPIPLEITMSRGAIDKYKFFMIVGLPDGFEMSTGFPTKNAWLVSVNNVEGLQILPNSDFVGSVRLQIMLFKGKDDVPETRTVSLTVAEPRVGNLLPREMPVAATTPAREQITAPATPKVVKRSISDEEEGRSMVRAYEMLQNADIAAARLIYEAMAMKGSAKAAFAMGQTYDPDFLQNFVVEGLRADITQARKWYQRALNLGSPEAEARLSALDRGQ
jgi:TPR repeat protein